MSKLILLVPIIVLFLIGLITYGTLINPEGEWSRRLLFLVPVLAIPMSIGLIIMSARYSNKMTGSSKTREEYLEEIKGLVKGGPVTVIEGIRGENSYKFQFTYKNREYEFLDLLKLFYNSQTRRHEVMQDVILLKTKIDGQLSILFQKELGNSFIGQAAEKIMDVFPTKGCEPIDAKDLNNFYPEFRVFANQVGRAKGILTDRIVVDIIRSFIKKHEIFVTFLPLQIKNGFVELNFYYYVNIKDKPALVIEYLDKIDSLANRIT